MDANRRKVHDRAEAVDLLEEWQRSGLALADFSRSCGVDGRSLNCWKLNLARSQAPSRPLQLVELDLPRRRASYRIRVHEFEVEVDDDFDPSNLAQLLDVVRGC